MSEKGISPAPLGNVKRVVLVLGKRLCDNQLTAEGHSRVAALAAYLTPMPVEQTALIFCGGQLRGQKRSEACAMADHFQHLFAPLADSYISFGHLILEGQSENTIENMENAASKLIASGVCERKYDNTGQPSDCVEICLVSNEYHLQRIIEIQKMMPEQGLLTTLTQRCEQAGLHVTISLDITQHCAVPYPHKSEQAQAFLLVDELTTYRVYMEGVLKQAFTAPIELVSIQPYQVAKRAIAQLLTLECTQAHQGVLTRMAALIEQTQSYSVGQLNASNKANLLQPLYAEFHSLLTQLNRRFDPESDASTPNQSTSRG